MARPDSQSFAALQRSKTAPTPLVESPDTSVAQWSGSQVAGRINRSSMAGIRTKPKTHRTTVDGGDALGGAARASALAVDVVAAMQTHVRSPLVSPRHDVSEDPFSLAGFFPSRPGSPDHALEWAWRSPVEATMQEMVEEEEEEEKAAEESWGRLPAARSLSMNALDEYAREVIAKESKLGIFGLARVPSFFKSISESYFSRSDFEEDQQAQTQTQVEFEFPSIAMDEPYDTETLCESMRHSRQVAAAREVVVPAEQVPSLGLFSPATESSEVELGWAGTLYGKLV